MPSGISRVDPMAAELDDLFSRHHAEMHADTPPESIHMLPREALAGPEIAFYVMRDENGAPLGMGAIKRLDAGEGELKSMHVLSEQRGRGHSRALLGALVEAARGMGIVRLSLETGAQPSFAAARALYLGAGFVECPPFGDYRRDPMSVYMTYKV